MAGSASSTAAVEVRGLRLSFRRGFTLGPLDLTFGPGVTALVGSNGAGKTTLFRLLAGLDRPSAGDLTRVRGRVGFVPQSPTLPGHATVSEYLHHVAWLYRLTRDERTERVAASVAAVNLTKQKDARIKALSGGMARRVAIASALVCDPALLLLDEPTVGLDPVQRASVREGLTAAGSGRTTIVSTHLVEDVRAMAQRVVILDAGQVRFDGDLVQLCAHSPGPTDAPDALERAVLSMMTGGSA